MGIANAVHAVYAPPPLPLPGRLPGAFALPPPQRRLLLLPLPLPPIPDCWRGGGNAHSTHIRRRRPPPLAVAGCLADLTAAATLAAAAAASDRRHTHNLYGGRRRVRASEQRQQSCRRISVWRETSMATRSNTHAQTAYTARIHQRASASGGGASIRAAANQRIFWLARPLQWAASQPTLRSH